MKNFSQANIFPIKSKKPQGQKKKHKETHKNTQKWKFCQYQKNTKKTTKKAFAFPLPCGRPRHSHIACHNFAVYPSQHCHLAPRKRTSSKWATWGAWPLTGCVSQKKNLFIPCRSLKKSQITCLSPERFCVPEIRWQLDRLVRTETLAKFYDAGRPVPGTLTVSQAGPSQTNGHENCTQGWYARYFIRSAVVQAFQNTIWQYGLKIYIPNTEYRMRGVSILIFEFACGREKVSFGMGCMTLVTTRRCLASILPSEFSCKKNISQPSFFSGWPCR